MPDPLILDGSNQRLLSLQLSLAIQLNHVFVLKTIVPNQTPFILFVFSHLFLYRSQVALLFLFPLTNHILLLDEFLAVMGLF